MSNRKYTLEFKEEAIKLVTEQGYSRKEAGRSLGVSDKNISRWLLELNNPISNKMSSESKELINLRKENKRLRLEREILKKAAAFFASEHT